MTPGSCRDLAEFARRRLDGESVPEAVECESLLVLDARATSRVAECLLSRLQGLLAGAAGGRSVRQLHEPEVRAFSTSSAGTLMPTGGAAAAGIETDRLVDSAVAVSSRLNDLNRMWPPQCCYWHRLPPRPGYVQGMRPHHITNSRAKKQKETRHDAQCARRVVDESHQVAQPSRGGSRAVTLRPRLTAGVPFDRCRGWEATHVRNGKQERTRCCAAMTNDLALDMGLALSPGRHQGLQRPRRTAIRPARLPQPVPGPQEILVQRCLRRSRLGLVVVLPAHQRRQRHENRFGSTT